MADPIVNPSLADIASVGTGAPMQAPPVADTRPATLGVTDRGGRPVPDISVGDALATGEATFSPVAPYALLDPTGRPAKVLGQHVYDALRQGWTLESTEGRELREARDNATLIDKAGAGAIGAVDSLSFGTLPALVEGIGGKSALRDYKLARGASEEAATVGEVLGLITPMGLEGVAAKGFGAASKIGRGALLAGDVATLGPRALSRVARGVGELTSKALPEATTALGRALTKGARLGVEGAVEGAAYGTGYAVGESSLGDKELTAERLLAAAGGGALLGAGIGGGLGVVGSGAASLAERGIGGLEGFAERQAWKATGATGAMTRKVGLEQAKRSGRRMLDEGLLKFESFEERAAALRTATNDAGSQIGKLIERIDETGQRANVAPIIEKLDEQLGKLRDGVGADVRLAKRIDRDFGGWLRDRAVPGAEPTFKELHSMRTRVDDYLEKAKGSRDTILIDEYGKLRGAIEDEVKRQADAAAPRMGDTFLGEYTAAKSRYQDLINATKVAEYRAPMLEAGNRSISLTDTIAAAGGLAAGGPGGLLMGGANKLMREYGDTAAALLANKLGKRTGSKVPTLAEVMGAAPRAANDTAPDLYNRLIAGDVPESAWKFDRGGMRDASSGFYSKAYSGPAAANDIATGRVLPPGSKEPLHPLQLIIDGGEVQLRDGRHALAAAQAAGATEISATVQTLDDFMEHGPLAAKPTVIAIPGRGRGPSADVIRGKLEALGYVKAKADKVALALSKDVTDAVKNPAHAIATRQAAGVGTYEALAADAREHRVAPDRSATKVAARIAPLIESAPELSRALTVKATGDLEYLSRQLPNAGASGVSPAQSKSVQPSGSERASFERKARAVQEPQSAVFDMKHNKLSEDAIAAIKERRPLMLAKIQEEAERAYADLVRQGKLPDRQNRLQLEKLLERKIDPASNPVVIKIVQRAYANHAKMSAPSPVSPSGSTRAERMMSEGEKIARGDM